MEGYYGWDNADENYYQHVIYANDPGTAHYQTPQTYSSPPSSSRFLLGSTDDDEEEGHYTYPDYMKILIEPFQQVELPEVCSTISSSEVSCVEPELQRTVAIVKPDAMEYKDVVLRELWKSGFKIIGARTLHLTPEQVSELYSRHYGSPSFPHLVLTVSSAPVFVISMASMNAISKWNGLIGPDGSLREEWFYPLSVRLRFGVHPCIPQVLHGSENVRDSNRENRYFFPTSVLEPLTTDELKVTDYLSVYVNPTLTEGLTELVKRKPMEPIIYLAEWLLMNNPFQPRLPHDVATSPT